MEEIEVKTKGYLSTAEGILKKKAGMEQPFHARLMLHHFTFTKIR